MPGRVAPESIERSNFVASRPLQWITDAKRRTQRLDALTDAQTMRVTRQETTMKATSKPRLRKIRYTEQLFMAMEKRRSD